MESEDPNLEVRKDKKSMDFLTPDMNSQDI